MVHDNYAYLIVGGGMAADAASSSTIESSPPDTASTTRSRSRSAAPTDWRTEVVSRRLTRET